MNAGGFDRFIERHRRQNGGDAFGQHGFSGAGRADQQNVVATGAGYFQGALGGHLTAHVAHIDGILIGFGEHLRGIDLDRFERFGRVDQIDGLRQRFHAEDANAFDHRGFAGVGFGDDHVFDAAFARGERGGKGSAHGTHAAIQRKLAKENVRIENFAEESSLAASEPQRHGQIERRAFLANIRGREIDGDEVGSGKIESAIAQRGADALAAFFHRNVREADDGEMTFEGGRNVDFDFNQIGVDAEDGGAECLE